MRSGPENSSTLVDVVNIRICSHILHAVIPERSKVTSIHCWFLFLSLILQRFLHIRFSESFDDVMDC